MSIPVNKMTERELLEGAYLAATEAKTDICRLTIRVEQMNARISDLEWDFHHEVRRLDMRIDNLERRLPPAQSTPEAQAEAS